MVIIRRPCVARARVDALCVVTRAPVNALPVVCIVEANICARRNAYALVSQSLGREWWIRSAPKAPSSPSSSSSPPPSPSRARRHRRHRRRRHRRRASPSRTHRHSSRRRKVARAGDVSRTLKKAVFHRARARRIARAHRPRARDGDIDVDE